MGKLLLKRTAVLINFSITYCCTHGFALNIGKTIFKIFDPKNINHKFSLLIKIDQKQVDQTETINVYFVIDHKTIYSVFNLEIKPCLLSSYTSKFIEIQYYKKIVFCTFPVCSIIWSVFGDHQLI